MRAVFYDSEPSELREALLGRRGRHRCVQPQNHTRKQSQENAVPGESVSFPPNLPEFHSLYRGPHGSKTLFALTTKELDVTLGGSRQSLALL